MRKRKPGQVAAAIATPSTGTAQRDTAQMAALARTERITLGGK